MNQFASGSIIRCRFVKKSGAGTVAQNDTAGGPCVGISGDAGNNPSIPLNTDDPPYAAKNGQQLYVHGSFQGNDFPCLQIGSGGCSVGTLLKSDNAGKGVAASANGDWIHAIAMEAGAEDALVKVQWMTSVRYVA